MYTRVECCELIEQLVKQLTSQLKPEEFILKRDTDLCISVPNIAGQGQADATLHCDVAVFKTYYGTQHSTYPFVVFNFWPQVDKGAEQCPGQTEVLYKAGVYEIYNFFPDAGIIWRMSRSVSMSGSLLCDSVEVATLNATFQLMHPDVHVEEEREGRVEEAATVSESKAHEQESKKQISSGRRNGRHRANNPKV